MTGLLTRQGNPLYDGWAALGAVEGPFGMRSPTMEQAREAARLLDVDITELEAMLAKHGRDTAGLVAPHSLRRAATRKYAWAIPDDEALNCIAQYGPIVEIGAGTGYWASLLAERGVDVLAYDLWPAGHPQNHWHSEPGVFHPVTPAPAEAAGRHPDRTLFVCWPPYAPTTDVRWSEPEDLDGWERHEYEFTEKTIVSWRRPNQDPDVAYLALLAYEAAGGQRVIYIGEGSGGCTAGPAFHALIGFGCDHYDDEPCDCPEPRWEKVAHQPIPQWDGMHDHLWVLERR